MSVYRVKRFRQFCCYLLGTLGLFMVLMVQAEQSNQPGAELTPPPNPLMDEQQIRQFLETVTKTVILPRYQNLQQQAVQLQQQAKKLCAQPSLAGLQATRQAWSAVLVDWQRAGSWLFGPVLDYQMDFSIYFHPVKKRVIKRLLNDPALDAEAVSKAGVGGQGLATVEYLLFDRERNDEQILQDFSKGSGASACVYLQAVTDLLTRHTQSVNQRWQPSGKNYAADFYKAGKGSAYFVEAQDALETLVNKMYQNLQSVSSRKLTAPLGSQQGEFYPYKLESWRSGHSLLNIQANLDGVADILQKGGLIAYLSKHQQSAMAKALEQSLQQLDDLQWDRDLFALFKSAPTEEQLAEFNQALALSRALHQIIRDQLAPALGVQLGFNDNDGD